MDGEGRGFEEIKVSVCSAQAGGTRVSILTYGYEEPRCNSYESKDDHPLPRPSPWRNNLTGLSQYRNLYFVALAHQIYVFNPEFPTQILQSQPALILDPPPTRPQLVGYIDPGQPHIINQLIVGDLGIEELIICARDSGDVFAYTTRSIDALLRAQSPFQDSRPLGSESLRPYFMTNVGMSAWGLAVHKTSRMIAASSNTHDITVFAFALQCESSREGSEGPDKNESRIGSNGDMGLAMDENPEKQVSDWNQPGTLPIERSLQNLRITLSGHETNIPSISFCNTEDDQSGEYLVSTDIEGELIVWDIWKKVAIRRFSLASQLGQAWLDRRYPLKMLGWGVLCLNYRSFRLTEGSFETFGCEPESIPKGWDISCSRNMVKDNSAWHPGCNLVPTDDEIDEAIAQDSDDYEDSDEYEELEDEDSLDGDVTMHIPSGPNLSSPGENGNNQSSGGYSALNENASYPTNRAKVGPRKAVIADTGRGTASRSEQQNLPFGIMCTSEREVATLIDDSCPKIVILGDVFHQKLPPHLNWLSRFERINMIMPISELGVVVVGSQLGRAAILTLTQMRGTKQYAFRLERIVPFGSQEDQCARPKMPLLGIAVAPIQGHEFEAVGLGPNPPEEERRESWRAADSSRRYRLLLTYSDHTMLSYEISRGKRHESKVEKWNDLLVF